MNSLIIGKNTLKISRGYDFSNQSLIQCFEKASETFWQKISDELITVQDRSLIDDWELICSISKDLLNSLAKHHPESALDSIQGAFYALHTRITEGTEKNSLNVVKDALGMIIQDIGKQFVSPDILNQSTPLEETQRQAIATHVKKGYELLEEQKNDFLTTEIGPAILEHHMPWRNGAGDQSNYGSIIRLYDVFGSMTSPYRYYGARKSIEQALEELKSGGEENYNQEAVSLLKNGAEGLTSCCPNSLIPPVSVNLTATKAKLNR